jgi:hypothetical protein
MALEPARPSATNLKVIYTWIKTAELDPKKGDDLKGGPEKTIIGFASGAALGL